MPYQPPAHYETSKSDSSNETKIKEKQNETIPELNSNLLNDSSQSKHGTDHLVSQIYFIRDISLCVNTFGLCVWNK
jgi:hypothetical protein